jgi:hypothetical protein
MRGAAGWEALEEEEEEEEKEARTLFQPRRTVM